MLEIDDEEERLRRAYDVAAANDGSGSSALPAEGLGLEEIRALAAQEQAADPQVASPMRKPLMPKPVAPVAAAVAPPATEKVVQTGQPNPDEFELAWARAEDKRARNRQRTELGARQLIAGLTRTPVAPVGALPASEYERAMERRRMEAGRENAAANRALAGERLSFGQDEALRKAAVAAANRDADMKRKAELDKRAGLEKDEDQELARERIRVGDKNADATRALAGAGLGLRQDEAEARATDRAQGVPDELRKEFNALPEVKQFNGVATSYEKMKGAASNASAAGDLSLIFNFMRMLDPGSAVKEGEFANAQNATGVPGRVINEYNRVLNGERLSDAQRADFMKQAQSFYDVERGNYDKQAERYRGLAAKRGANPDDVTSVRSSPKGGGTEVTATNPKTGERVKWNGKEWVPL